MCWMILLINKIMQFIEASKMKPIDITYDFYAEYNEYSNVNKPKFRVGEHARISKYKNIFVKRYTQKWSEEVFIVSKIKKTVRLMLLEI